MPTQTSSQTTSQTSSQTELRDELLHDHARMNALFDRLVECIRADDRAEMGTVWTGFERALLAHMDWEEMYLLPAFEQTQATEAARLRADHARFRALLGEVGVGIDLHLVRVETIEAMVALLRSHAAREEGALYRWVAQDVDPQAARMVAAHRTAVH